jgi:multiple sugar transport system permease protein
MSQQISLKRYAFRKEKKRQTAGKAASLLFFLGPYLFCFALFVIYPLIYGIILSFAKFDGTSLTPSGFVGWDNFVKVFTNRVMIKDYWSAVWYTFRFELIIVPLCLIIPLFLALLVNVKPWGYKFFRACIYLPGIFPLTATGLILLRMFSQNSGFINAFFNSNINWFGDPTLAWVMVGLFCIWGGIGGNFIIFSAGLENVDKTLYEAGEMDGVNVFQRIRYITLPGIRSQLVLCFFTTMIGYMNLYGQNYILTSNTPDQSAVMTAVYRIQNMLLGSSKGYGLAAAMAVTLGAIIGFMSVLQMLSTREKKGGERHVKDFRGWKQSHLD